MSDEPNTPGNGDRVQSDPDESAAPTERLPADGSSSEPGDEPAGEPAGGWTGDPAADAGTEQPAYVTDPTPPPAEPAGRHWGRRLTGTGAAIGLGAGGLMLGLLMGGLGGAALAHEIGDREHPGVYGRGDFGGPHGGGFSGDEAPDCQLQEQGELPDLDGDGQPDQAPDSQP